MLSTQQGQMPIREGGCFLPWQTLVTKELLKSRGIKVTLHQKKMSGDDSPNVLSTRGQRKKQENLGLKSEGFETSQGLVKELSKLQVPNL